MDNTGVLLEVVTMATLPEVAVSIFNEVADVMAADVVFDDTSAAKVGAVSDVTKIGCANFGRDAM